MILQTIAWPLTVLICTAFIGTLVYILVKRFTEIPSKRQWDTLTKQVERQQQFIDTQASKHIATTDKLNELIRNVNSLSLQSGFKAINEQIIEE